jgi:outer membrane receptor for ferrienterochelin and colicin
MIFISTSLYAQDLLEMNLEDLLNMDVTTASKKAEKLSDAPGIISTITSQEIKNFGANTLYDVLNMAPSLQPLGSHLFVDNKAAIRGELNTHADNHVLILLNGRAVREGTSGGANSAIYSGFPVELIDKVEIIRCPGSVLYGTNAYAGVINVITKKSVSDGNVNISGGAGSFGTTIASANGSYSSDDFNALVGAKLYTQDGWDFSMVTKRPGADDMPVDMKYGQKSVSVFTDLSYKNFKVLGLYIDNSQDALGILPYAIFAGKNKYSRFFLNAGYEHKLSNNWEASINASYDASDYTLNDEALVSSDHHASNDYLAEITVNGDLGNDVNLIVGGVVYSRNKNSVKETDVVPEYNQVHLSSYVQADYRPVENLKLILGAQLNKPDEGDVDVTPRVGAIYNINEQFGVKALYAQAFRSPWPLEQLIDNVPVLHGNADLGPEKIATTDIQLFYSGKNAEAAITYFNSHYSDLVVRIPYSEGGLTFTNKGSMDLSGLELTGKVSIQKNIFMTGAISYYMKDVDISALPDFMAKIGVFYHTNFGVTAGLFNTYYGEPVANGAPEDNPVAEAVNLLDANVAYKLPVSLPVEVSVTVKNLLNSEYNFTEYARNWVNSFPAAPGTAVYGKVSLNL